MRHIKAFVYLFIFAASFSAAPGLAVDTYTNPLDVVVADPFIFWDAADECYYMTGSGQTFWKSDDAVNWKVQGTLFASSVTSSWGCEITKGDDGKYYLFASERSPTSGDIGPDGILQRQTISVFRSDSMETNSFVLYKRELIGIGQPDPEDLIGAHVFRDGNNYYLYYTLDQTSYADPVNGHDASIWVQQINSTFTGTIGNPQKLVWPSDANDNIWCEGVHVWKNGGTYYLFYSTFCFANENYRIRVVKSSSPTGFSNSGKVATPLLMKQQLTGGYLSGPGSSCIFETKDGDELFLGYHNHVSSVMGTGFRQLAIDRITFSNGNASVTPTRTKQPLPSGSSLYYPYWQISNFPSWPLGGHWKNVFNQDDAKVTVNSGWLEFIPKQPIELTDSGVTEVYNKNVYLCYTTLSFNTNIDFIVKVNVDRDSASTNTIYGGVTVWQDSRENIQIRLLAPSQDIDVVITSGGVPTVYSFTPIALSLTKYLRFRYKQQTDRFRFAVSDDGASWNDLGYWQSTFSGDRKLEAGLVTGTDGFNWNNKVRFDFFTMEQW